MRCLATMLLLASLAGCATPDTPEIPGGKPIPPEPRQVILPTAWQHASATETIAIRPWWTALNDAVLNDLITQALTSNPDVAIAEARLNEIRATVAAADPDERVMAVAELSATESDAHVVQLEVAHAVTMHYADARLAEKRKDLLRQRMQLAQDLTARLHRRLEAGLANTRSLREAEQTEIETHQASTKAHQDHQQAMARLALLSGLAPVAFKLPPGADLFSEPLAMQPESPATIMDRRPDVQAAWQRLLAASAADPVDDDLPLAAQIEQADASAIVRDAIYRKSVLAALQGVEAALAGWRWCNSEARSSHDFLEIQTANVRDVERELAAGRVSRIELLKAMLTENLARENALLAQHAQRVAFAAAQLALARD